MVKKILFVAAILFAIAPCFSINTVNAEESTQEQACFNSDPSLYENVALGGEYSQSFYAGKNTIDQVVLGVSGLNSSGNATFKITDASNNIITQVVRDYQNLSDHEYWYMNSFDPVTVVPGQKYKIWLTSDAVLYWYKTISCDCTGNAVANNFSLSGADYEFGIWSYTEAQSTPPAQTDEGSQTPSTTEVTTSAAPVAATDSSIGKPTDLASTISDDKKLIRLNWTKSSSGDIDGYRVYRSLDRNKNYKRIVQVDKNALEYNDGDGLADGAIYYYFVRAYRGTNESANSNVSEITYTAPEQATVSEETVTVEDTSGDIATTENENVNSNTTNWTQIAIYAGLGVILLILIYIWIAIRKRYWPFAKNRIDQPNQQA